MSGFPRLALTLLLLLALAGVSLLVVDYRTGAIARQRVLEVATTGDLRDLFETRTPSGAMLVNLTLRRLESDYYKPIDPQTPISGEIAALRSVLAAKKISGASLPGAAADGNPSQDGERAGSVLAYAEEHYAAGVGPAGREDLTDAALRGIMNSVRDPYTVYLSPHEIQGLNESLSGGNFGGIGVYIYELRDGRIVVQPIEDMPAARAGMKPGEVVESVNGKTARGLSIDRVEEMIRGEAGTIVRLRAHPFNAPSHVHVYAIVREIIHVPTVRAKMEDGLDYVRLSDFGTTSADEVRKALLDGKERGARGYILDLRDNGGGLLDAAVDISSLFVTQGTIVSTIRRDGQRTSEEARGNALGGLHPLVILVNKYTASASEITAGALQDYRLALLVGTRTFGKGVVQSIYPLPDNGALKITTARYVTPAGRDIQHHGIEPDVVIDQDPNPALIDTPADKQLAAAKARFRTQFR
ncbi:MAG: S41 family peptidase [Candidatus Eremiobacteraeota bacterium]|nr:S41 family peptidase [Candidatus Eremiobacteraeota bacterium]